MLPALGQAQTGGVSVPLMLAPDSERQGFVRIINETDQAGRVRITAVDDAGNAASPIEIELEAGASLHFNSDDLADGNSAKGIDSIGQPRQGHWRLRVEAAEGVQVMAFVRTRAGFLTAMHDVLPRNDQGRIVARMLNPGSNRNQESSLRLVNTGTNSERVSIRGTDDRSRSAGPVTLTLAAGQARTITAFDLENGAQGLTGSLGDGGGKWRLTIEAGQAVMGMGLLETPAGPITNISTIGLPPTVRAPSEPDDQDDQGNSFANAFNLGSLDDTMAIATNMGGGIDPAGESDYYRIRVSESGTLDVYTSGSLDTRGYLYDSGERQLASNDDGSASDGLNFRISREVDAGTYYARVEAYYRDATGGYTFHAELDASTEPEPPEPPTDPEPTGGYYGAYAIGDPIHRRSRSCNSCWTIIDGFAGNLTRHQTQEEADQDALDNCNDTVWPLHGGPANCRIETRFGGGQCIVYAKNGSIVTEQDQNGISTHFGYVSLWEVVPRAQSSAKQTELRSRCEAEVNAMEVRDIRLTCSVSSSCTVVRN